MDPQKRFRLGTWFMVSGVLLGSITVGLLFGPGLRDPLEEVMGLPAVAMLTTGIVLVALAVRKVSTTAVWACCLPGLAGC